MSNYPSLSSRKMEATNSLFGSNKLLAKRTAFGAALSPPNHNIKKPNNMQQEHLADFEQKLELMGKIAANINEVLENASADNNIKLIFNTLMCVLDSAKTTINLLQKQQTDNSAEEQERRRSIVMIGLAEPNCEKASERVEADKKAVIAVMDQLGVEAEPVAVYRLGRPNISGNNKPRLLKCVFPASVHQHICLGRWRVSRDNMKKQKQWERLLIRPSLTREQLAIDREARKLRYEAWRNRHGQRNMAADGNDELFTIAAEMNKNSEN